MMAGRQTAGTRWLDRGQKILLAEGALAAMLYALSTGNFMAGYLGSLGAAPGQIAMIAMVPQLGCVLQLFTPLFFERRSHRKRGIILFCFLFRFLAGAVVLAPYLFRGRAQLDCAFALYAVAFLSAGFVTPALNQWIIQIAPLENRGQYFAVKDIAAQLVTAAAAFGMGRMLDAAMAAGNARLGFSVIYGACVVGSLVDLWLMLQLPDRRSEPMPDIRAADLLAPLRDRNFRPLLTYELIGYLGSMFSAGFLSTYQLNVLGLTHTFITSVGMVSSVVSMGCIFLWGRLADRTYWTSVVLATKCLNALSMLGWWLLPVSHAETIAPVLMILTAVCGASSMCGVNLLYDHSPAEGKTTYLGVTAALGSLLGYGAALVGSGVQHSLETSMGGASIALLFAVSGGILLLDVGYGFCRLPRKRPPLDR